ncbi:MAG TPA: YceI family protein [Puia sp.]|jgi:polyisoprenoid-binding protein YceI|nr:YceI family protein [Puia sp.]
MKKIIAITAAFLLTAAAGFAQDWTWDKAHSQLNFGVTHMGINEIDGTFTTADAKMTASKEDLTDAQISLTADVNSINTGNEQRNNHLKSEAFFDAAKYGTLTFTSTSFTKVGGKNYTLTGNLTMHGVTKSVTLNVVFNGTVTNPQNHKTSAGFKVTGIIKRSDFGIATGFPSSAVSDEVTLNANVELVKS